MTPPPFPPLSPDQLATAAAEADRLVAAVRPDQWSSPTPCPDWDVRALVTHLTAGTTHLVTALVATAPEPRDGGDPAADHRASVEALLAATRTPGALARTVSIPFGTVPVPTALHLRVIEFLVHGWDLAQATGGTLRASEPLVEQELAVSRAALAGMPPERRPFGPPRPVAPDAPALDRLVALLGRHPAGPGASPGAPAAEEALQ